MLSTNLAVFETASNWKLSFINRTFSIELTRLLMSISLAHRPTELLFSLAQKQKFVFFPITYTLHYLRVYYKL